MTTAGKGARHLRAARAGLDAAAQALALALAAGEITEAEYGGLAARVRQAGEEATRAIQARGAGAG